MNEEEKRVQEWAKKYSEDPSEQHLNGLILSIKSLCNRPPNGYSIDLGNMKKVMVGTEEFSIFDLLHLHRLSGAVIRNQPNVNELDS